MESLRPMIWKFEKHTLAKTSRWMVQFSSLTAVKITFQLFCYQTKFRRHTSWFCFLCNQLITIAYENLSSGRLYKINTPRSATLSLLLLPQVAACRLRINLAPYFSQRTSPYRPQKTQAWLAAIDWENQSEVVIQTQVFSYRVRAPCIICWLDAPVPFFKLRDKLIAQILKINNFLLSTFMQILAKRKQINW